MLTRGRAAAAALALLLCGSARAEEDDDALRRPEQLTIGVSDQFLGQLTPDGKTLYFVTNRNTTNEIYRQEMGDARGRELFDEGADVTWPRVSPDGKRLLYISFRDDAAGQLCVRDLPRADKRRCLGDGSQAVQAQWRGPGHILLVSRTSVEGDLRVMEVSVGRKLTARPFLETNLTNPTISPDGRWLVYVPIERYVERVGPSFAARAAPRLEAVRLDRPGNPMPFSLDLPGITGQPAFSADGKRLYFAQFFNDSNRDGVIDASDHAVLFRVPWQGERDDAPLLAGQAFAEQLTDSNWNCQYPAPAAARLVATCSRKSGLDIYALPLDGVVPDEWDAERLELEIGFSGRPIEHLLLYRHLLERATSPTAKRAHMMHLILLHYDFEEFDSAAFYAHRIDKLDDAATDGLEEPLIAQVEHRRAVRAREHGRIDLDFVKKARQRMEALDPAAPKAAEARVMRRLVRSEIAQDLGDFTTARAELEAAPIEEAALLPVIASYYDRADALYRLLDDRAALVAACRRLALHPRLQPDQQLDYALAAARAVARGLPRAEAVAALRRERARVPADSELAFALELRELVDAVVSPEPPGTVVDPIVALYDRQKRADRQRALMLDAVSQASAYSADELIETLAQRYVDDMPPHTQARRRAERLYRKVMLGRAYRAQGAGKHDEAARNFLAAALTTGSLEGHIGYIEARRRTGARPADLAAEYAARKEVKPQLQRFISAYLLVRKLPDLDGAEHDKALKEALTHLKAVGPELRGKPEVRAVWGAALHDEFLDARDLPSAQRADVHYRITLEQVGRNPRYKAMVLGQLGLLHTQVGNYRIALDYLDDRDKLPFGRDAAGLSQRLMRARTLLHVGRDEDAAKEAEEALKMAEAAPKLQRYLPLVVDRAALYNLAADHYARALALYDRLLPLLAGAGLTAERNRTAALLARAAAALGAEQPRRALEDLAGVDRSLADRHLRSALVWPHATPDEVLRTYRLIAAGLRAQAHRGVGELDQAAHALETERRLLVERFRRSRLDEHVRALTLVEMQLAELARERSDAKQAAHWVRAALGHADEYARRSRAPVDEEQLDVLWFAADLRLGSGVRLGFDLKKRLEKAYAELLAVNDPKLRGYTRWFESYLALYKAKGTRLASLEEADPAK